MPAALPNVEGKANSCRSEGCQELRGHPRAPDEIKGEGPKAARSGAPGSPKGKMPRASEDTHPRCSSLGKTSGQFLEEMG